MRGNPEIASQDFFIFYFFFLFGGNASKLCVFVNFIKYVKFQIILEMSGTFKKICTETKIIKRQLTD